MAWQVVTRSRDAEEAEALALLEGAKLAEHWSSDIHVEFESDCANLIQMVQGPLGYFSRDHGYQGELGTTLIKSDTEDLERTKQNSTQFGKLHSKVLFCATMYS
jgi:hypothetical protein